MGQTQSEQQDEPMMDNMNQLDIKSPTMSGEGSINKALKILGQPDLIYYSDNKDNNTADIKEVRVGIDLKGTQRYDILESLGKGRQGQVYKVIDRVTGTFFAMKTIEGQSSSRKHRLSLSPGRSMQAEIKLLRRIKHENIVRLIEVVDSPDDNTMRLILEYVPGGCIKQLSDSQVLSGTGIPLEEENTRSYFRQLLAALDYMFCHGIIHRDIKPSNIMINTTTGKLKLGDFGIAISTCDSKAARILGTDDDIFAGMGMVGTPAFLPPEYYRIVYGDTLDDDMIESDSEETETEDTDQDSEDQYEASPYPVPQSYHGRDADIWAAGMTLYAFTYGSLPFIPTQAMSGNGEEMELPGEELAYAIMNNPLKFPGTGLGTSPKLRNLLTRLLEKNPSKRAQLPELFVDPWVCKHEPMPRLTDVQKTPIFSSGEHKNSDEIPIMFHLKRVGRKIRSHAHILHHKARASLHRIGEDMNDKSDETRQTEC